MVGSSGDKPITYGCFSGDPSILIFMDRDDALEQAATWDALYRSKTWGELRKALKDAGEDAYSHVFDEYWHEREVTDDDPFDIDSLGEVSDGEWPPPPARVMAEWLPGSVQDMATTLGSDGSMWFDEKDEPRLLEEMARHGYLCDRDDDVISRACGAGS